MKYFKSQKDLRLIRKAEKLLFDLGDQITNVDSMEEVCGSILYTAIRIIPNADKGSILMLEQDGLFHFRYLVGYDESMKDITLRREEVYLYKMNNFSETAIIKEPLEFDKKELVEEKSKEIDRMTGVLHCTLSTPIYIDGELIALMNVDSVTDKKYFKHSDISLMNYIKNQLILSLKNFYIREKLTYFTNYDDLTGLFNRRYLNKKLIEELEKINEHRKKCYLVVIDLDNFKTINDYCGHAAGDNALRAYSNTLKELLKDGEIYGRMSGDEFVIFFMNTDREYVTAKMEAIQQSLRYTKVSNNMKLGFSYGIAEVNKFNAGNINDIYAAADMEMYKHKRWKKSLVNQ